MRVRVRVRLTPFPAIGADAEAPSAVPKIDSAVGGSWNRPLCLYIKLSILALVQKRSILIGPVVDAWQIAHSDHIHVYKCVLALGLLDSLDGR